jgi:hypothetical protein
MKATSDDSTAIEFIGHNIDEQGRDLRHMQHYRSK